MAARLPLLLWAALGWQPLLAVDRDAAPALCGQPGKCASLESTRGSALVQVKSRMEAKAAPALGETGQMRKMLKLDSRGQVVRNHTEVLLLQEEENVEAMRPATASEQAAFLREHNEVRCMHGSPAVSWSIAMAASAAEYAGPLRSLRHSQSYDIAPPAGPAGENLFWSSAASTPAQVVTSWYSEVDYCRGGPSGFTDGCQNGAGGETGHFTALIWKGVKEIGCAWSDDNKIALCRYKGDDVLNGNTPNMQGQYVQQVPRKIKDRAACQSGSSQPQPQPQPSPAPSTPAPTPSPSTSACVDSTSYRDPFWGVSCSGWKGYRCTGYSFSPQLLSNCPVACSQCTPGSPAPTPAAPTPAPPTPAPPTPAPPTPAPPTPMPPSPTPAPPTPAPPTPAPPTPAQATAAPTAAPPASAPSDGCVSGSGTGFCSLRSAGCGGQVSFSMRCTAADGNTFQFQLSMPDNYTWNLSDHCSQCYDVQVVA